MNPLEGQSIILDSSWLRPELIVSDVIYIIPEKRNCLKWLNLLAVKQSMDWACEEMPVDYVKEQMSQKTERK